MNTCNQIELDTSDITELEHTNCIRDLRIKVYRYNPDSTITT